MYVQKSITWLQERAELAEFRHYGLLNMKVKSKTDAKVEFTSTPEIDKFYDVHTLFFYTYRYNRLLVYQLCHYH